MTSLVLKRSLFFYGRPLHTTRLAANVEDFKLKPLVDRSRLRNIGIVAHINAGKTTTTERILYHAGSTNSVGDVDKGNTVTDYLDQERDRGITITSAAVSFNWKQHRINLIDTPGHVDFTIEVERSLAVLDGAITIIDASAGVEAQTITVWNQASRYKLPNVIFLNKYDKPQADYWMCMKDLKLNLLQNATLLHLPVVKAKNQKFTSFIDIVQRKCFTWTDPERDNGSQFDTEALVNFKEYLDLVEEQREKLVGVLSDIDDEFAEKVLECDKISDVSSEFISQAIRRTTLKCQFSPILIGSSFKYIGVQQLMDAIVNYLPSPCERENQILTNFGLLPEELSPTKTNSAFIFKIMHDKRLGPISYLRVLSGHLKRQQRVKTLESNKIEQVKKVYLPFADELKEIDGATKDDIIVVTGLTESRTGDILVDQNFDLNQQTNKTSSDHQSSLPFQVFKGEIIIPQINQMEPVYYCSIESRNSAQQLKLEHALACLSREDPSFRYEVDETGSTTIRGMGKLHLEVIRDRIQTEYKIEPLLGPLQISYRETVGGSATEELSVSRLINGVNNQLTIILHVRPAKVVVVNDRSRPTEKGLWVAKMLKLDTSGENNLGRLRSDHKKAIENGFQSAMNYGPSLGFPVINCEIILMDFKANYKCGLPVISSAASQCLAAALRRSSPQLLEPIMSLEVVVPKQYNGLVISDISARRGLVQSTQARGLGDSLVIRSRTPLAALADYSEFLRISTSGRASFSMELFGYSEVGATERQAIGRL